MLQNPYVTNEKQCLLSFYRQSPYMGYPPFVQENLDPLLLSFFRNPSPPVNKRGVHIILHIIPETVLMVRWMRVTFEFDQPYKHTESKMEVTGKISSNN